MTSNPTKKCPECSQEGTFEEESSGTDNFFICTCCGFLEPRKSHELQEQENWTGPENWVDPNMTIKIGWPLGGRSLKRGYTKAETTRKTHILYAVGALGFTASIKHRAYQILNNYYQAKAKRRQDAQTICYACLFISCRQLDYNVTLKEFCNKLGANRFKIAREKKTILSCLNMNDETTYSLEALIAKSIAEHQFPLHYEKTVSSLMRLVRKAWVSSGKSNEMYVWPCVFIIRRSEEKGAKTNPKGRKNKSFYDEFRLKPVMNIRAFDQHVGEVEACLLALTSRVPWLSSAHKNTVAGINRSLSWMLDNVEFLEEKIEEQNDCLDPEFAPKAAKKASLSIPEAADETPVQVAEGEELGELDIAEEDLHNYIKSPQEIKEVANLKRFLQQIEENEKSNIQTTLL